jgi:hypothetical protein
MRSRLPVRSRGPPMGRPLNSPVAASRPAPTSRFPNPLGAHPFEVPHPRCYRVPDIAKPAVEVSPPCPQLAAVPLLVTPDDDELRRLH